MDTSRIVINITDNSTTFEQETTEIVGFTVVRAPKGPITPVKISKNGAADLKDIFGVSSKEYPELFEAETFNREYDLYVSAPYGENTKVPAAYLTPNGIMLGTELVQYNSAVEAYALGEVDTIEGVKGIDTFTGIELPGGYLRDMRYPERYGLPGHSNANALIPQNYDISSITGGSELGGLLIHTGILYEDFKESESVSNIRIVNGSYVGNYTIDGVYIKNGETTVGVLVHSTDTDWAICSDDMDTDTDVNKIVWLYIYGDADVLRNTKDDTVRKAIKAYWVSTLTADDIYAVIFPKFPSERDLHITFTDFSEIAGYDGKKPTNWNKLKMRVYEDGAFRDATNSIYVEGSLDESDVASDGSYLGFSGLNSSYMNQNLVCVYKLKKFTSEDTVASITGFGEITLSNGIRDLDVDGDIHTAGWNKAHESEFSDVDLFFDSAIHDCGVVNFVDVNEVFRGLATDKVSAHELAGYVFNRTLTPTWLDNKNNLIGSNRLGYGRNYWNVCNVGIVEDRTKGTRFSVAMTGAHALMVARIIEYKHGGAAPMWENTSVSGVGIGGQLDMVSIYKLKYKYNKTQLDTLDDLNYNPVINDRQYGIMIVGQKTCKSGDTTDWSYIGHAAAFLNFIKEVRANVMIPQIGKPNNPYYRTLRKDQVDAYLAQRINGSDRIWAWAECDTSTADGVNDVHALKARKFVIKVRVQVDVFSEKVELNFTNEGQDSIISIQ